MQCIWTPHIMAHSTIMWCGNGRETTCHCGCERDSRTEARPGARRALQFTFSRSLSLFMSSLSFSSLPLCISHCLSNISCLFLELSLALSLSFSLCLSLSLSVFLIFPDLSTLTPGLLPLKECPMQAKAILWLFFERVYFMPLCNIKSRLNQWQSWKLNFWLYFWFYYASNQSFFTGKSLK